MSPESLDLFLSHIREIMISRFLPREERKTLRMSNLGKPDCQLWFDLNKPIQPNLSASDKRKFLYGDILEEFVLFLCREAGHTVTNEQQEVVVDGIVGHIDAEVDGVVVDVKSTSPYAYTKFSKGRLYAEDDFGYVTQLDMYSKALGKEAAWIAINKSTGEMCVLGLEKQEGDLSERISVAKRVTSSDSPPARCFAPVPVGVSGNMALGRRCGYCPHKYTCWKDANEGEGLRAFRYSHGLTYLVETVREPKVLEEFPLE